MLRSAHKKATLLRLERHFNDEQLVVPCGRASNGRRSKCAVRASHISWSARWWVDGALERRGPGYFATSLWQESRCRWAIHYQARGQEGGVDGERVGQAHNHC